MKDVEHLVRKSIPNGLGFVVELPNGLNGGFSPKMDRLVCYLPGTLALGATKGLTKEKAMLYNALSFEDIENLKLAEDLAKTCFEIYSVTSTGLAPDIEMYFHSEGIEAIRCMSFDVSMMKSMTLRASIFQKIRNLIFVKIYKSDWRKPSMLNIPKVLDYLSEELRFLSWEEYPPPYVPLNFCAENLITLKMCYSNIRQLWNGNQHFPNLQEIDLSRSKHLTALPDLSQAPKIEELSLEGCVNLAQIHSSTFPRSMVTLSIDDWGPKQIKVGGSIKWRSSGVVIVSSCLNLRRLSFDKVTMKVFVCGNTICGIRFKHEVMPKELRKEAQSLGSLFPFVSEVDCFEGPIEFGHDFNHHFDYYSYYPPTFSGVHEEERGDRGKMKNEHQVVTMSLMEDDEEDDVLMEDLGSKSVIFTRVPNSITRWSLLKELTLKSLPLSNEYCRRIKPHLDVTLSFPDITPSALHFPGMVLGIHHDLEQHPPSPRYVYFKTVLVWCLDYWGRKNGLEACIKRKQG